MDATDALPLLGAALALGLLIGVERGWHGRGAAEGGRVAGVRSYGLMGLLGGVTELLAQTLGNAALGFAMLALTAVLTTAYVLSLKRTGDIGITSLVAGLLTFVLGALAVHGQVAAASAAAVVTALLLGLKPTLHRVVAGLSAEELRAGLKLLLISVVLLPVLPDQGYGPWQALNPYRIWLMVVLIAAISFAGYFAVRIMGTGRGLLATALFAGLASSTALTLHYGRLARRQPRLAPLLATGILLACGTMFPRMVLLAGVLNPALVPPLLPPALVMAVCVFAPAVILAVRDMPHHAGEEEPALKNPLELSTALRFGALVAVIMLAAAALRATLGEAGIYLLAAASGIADVDPITLSLSQMTHDGLAVAVATVGIVIAGAVNSLFKAGLASATGGIGLTRYTLAPLGLAAAAGLGAVVYL